MKQIILIHGGDCFRTEEDFLEALKTWPYDPTVERKRRMDWLVIQTKDKYQSIKPMMPNHNNASYKARKVWFERIFPYLNNEELIVIGSSLGGIFLAKYLTENKFPKKINQLHLVAPVYDETNLPADDNYIGDFKFDASKVTTIQDQADQIFLYHSTDDNIVLFESIKQYQSQLPNAKLTTFTDRGHFNQETFPELLENIN